MKLTNSILKYPIITFIVFEVVACGPIPVPNRERYLETPPANLSSTKTIYVPSSKIEVVEKTTIETTTEHLPPSVPAKQQHTDTIVIAPTVTEDTTNSAESTMPEKIEVPLVKQVSTNDSPLVIEKPATYFEPNPNSELSAAKRHIEQGNYEGAIEILTPYMSASPNDVKSKELLATSYTRYATDLIVNEKLSDAQDLLDQAKTVLPGNEKILNLRKSVATRKETEANYQLGVQAMRKGENVTALKYLNKVVEVSPSHTIAKKHIAQLKSTITKPLINEAIKLYEHDDYISALSLFDKVIEIDGNNVDAKQYRKNIEDIEKRAKQAEMLDK